MKFILDTHLLLWWLAGSPKLPASARGLIADPGNTVFVSAVSLWEIWLKQSLGKLKLPSNFQEVLAGESFEHLPLAGSHTIELARLPWRHRDPFDRMLIAQARTCKLQLLTADETIASYGDPVLLSK